MVQKLKNSLFLRNFQYWYYKILIAIIGEERWECKKFKQKIGKSLNLQEPTTLNEKIAWLKINYYQDFYLQCCDKYLVHNYLKDKLGFDYAPSLIFVTKNPNELTYSNISKFPCIIKVSSGSGANLIVRDKDQYTEEYIQKLFKKYIIYSKIHARTTLEHQYIIDNPYIVVEELLNDGKGGIPNDYKFLYINGELSYIYCSVDRLGANVRQVYDENWNRLHFIWVEGADKKKFDRSEQSKSIPKPVNFELMKDLSGKLAKDYPLVRIDFYETGTQIYIGEITLHHGSGHDKFYPVSFDDYYGRMLNLPNPNRKN